MKFRKKFVVEATQWFKNGDHPLDFNGSNKEGKIVRYFNVPKISGIKNIRIAGIIFSLRVCNNPIFRTYMII